MEKSEAEGNNWLNKAMAFSPVELLLTKGNEIAMLFVEYRLVGKEALPPAPAKTKEEKMLEESEDILKASQALSVVNIKYLPPGDIDNIHGMAIKLVERGKWSMYFIGKHQMDQCERLDPPKMAQIYQWI